MRNNEKRSVIIWFVLAFFSFVFFSLIISLYVYPGISEIEWKKSYYLENKKEFKDIEKNWFTFSWFTKNSLKIKSSTNALFKDLKEELNNDYFKKIKKGLNEEFYEKSIFPASINKTWVFLNDIEIVDRNLDSVLKGDNFIKRNSNISKVLPKYSSYVDLDSDENLTDLKFISEVEWILWKYWLKTKSWIWISSLVSVENNILDKSDNIFYIPLNLDITWYKINVLKFVNYINSSWKIEFTKWDEGLNKWLSEDFNFIYDRVWKINQIWEVYSFSIDEYIDTSLWDEKRNVKNDTLIDFLSDTNQNDKISANLEIRFYVKGISNDKIIYNINTIIWKNIKQSKLDKNWNYIIDEKTGLYEEELIDYNYTNLSNSIKKLTNNPVIIKNKYKKESIDFMYSYLSNPELKKNIVELAKEMKSSKDLNSVYIKVLAYKEIFSKLDLEKKKIEKSLWIDINNK